MTTQGDKAVAAVEPEWVGRQVLANILGLSPATVTRLIAEWRAAGKIGKLKRKFHLPTVRRLALEASFESD